MSKVPLQYKVYRLACLFSLAVLGILFAISMMLPLTYFEIETIGFITSITVFVIMVGTGVAGVVIEVSTWFKKLK